MAERQLEEVGVLKLWADNAKDLKGGDGWDQWQKELKKRNTNDDGALEKIVLNYHAPH